MKLICGRTTFIPGFCVFSLYRNGFGTVALKKPKNGQLTDIQKTFNKAHNGIRAIGERGNSLLKTTFKALRNVSLRPWKIGK